jgi:hypothetical protein
VFDLHLELNTFYKNHILVSKDERDNLTVYRETNISRLKSGLKKLGYNNPIRTCIQGGVAMHTLVQRPENNPDLDHDIDIAIIFRDEDVPNSSLNARKRVLAGVVEGGGNFSKDPEARTNAVTVWYKNGYHVDLPVFRTLVNESENEVIEHAGAIWSPRDPMAITNWFNTEVNERSPHADKGATVKKYQMRRLVKFLKYFSRSRSGWKLPGGLVISALVSECYVPDYHRDDISLYKTIESIYFRLRNNLEVCNPVDTSQSLTDKNKYTNQVESLKDNLEEILEGLELLFSSCEKEYALRAWGKMFNHSYWEELASEVEEAKSFGEQLTEMRADGKLFVNSLGMVIGERGKERSIPLQEHRFFGDIK